MLRALLARLREFVAVEDPEERIEGSGEPYLDPAYNGRYTAERRLRDLARADEDGRPDDRPPEDP
ncbi:hypothetical protein BRC83_01955 [Halobacteriales archaeon QS_1_68_17]|nr:MAG: hypothetical protein BRC83_01955 [Halobacteriales archaeon QS_1_68_17]